MTDTEKLALLKLDLQLMTSAFDALLAADLETAEEFIATEGIRLTDTAADGRLVVMYAAYLYRHRANPDNAMPRMLRWALNNRLFSEKAR